LQIAYQTRAIYSSAGVINPMSESTTRYIYALLCGLGMVAIGIGAVLEIARFRRNARQASGSTVADWTRAAIQSWCPAAISSRCGSFAFAWFPPSSG
jgi:hypothetical protein